MIRITCDGESIERRDVWILGLTSRWSLVHVVATVDLTERTAADEVKAGRDSLCAQI